MESIIKSELTQHSDTFSKFMEMENEISNLYKNFELAINKNKKILIMGNGGSAADAQHFAAELVVKFEKVRKPIRSIALTTDSSILTATGNDFNFDEIFSRQVEALAEENDLVVGISTSGLSRNVLKALKSAKKVNARTLMLTGSQVVNKNFIDFEFNVPSNTTSRIQEMHLVVYHIICKLVDRLFDN